MPKKEKQNQPLAKVAFRFPGSLTHMLQCSCQTQVFLLKPENRSKDETNAGGPRILALGRAVQGVCHLSELAHIPRARPAWSILLAATSLELREQNAPNPFRPCSSQAHDKDQATKKESILDSRERSRGIQTGWFLIKSFFWIAAKLFIRTQEKPAGAGGDSPSFSNSQTDGIPPWDSTKESVTLLLQVLWVPVSINVGQNRQQHRNGEDSYGNADDYSNKEEAECFFRFGHRVLERILLMKFKF
jgi:hypothetical protein